MIFKTQLKASSLANAIFICLLISVFLGCLVFVSHYFNLINTKLELNERIINTNKASLLYYTTQLETLEYDAPIQTDILDENFQTMVTKKKWGFYDIITCETIFKTDTVVQSVLAGYQPYASNSISLYLTDHDNELKVSGASNLVGRLSIPKARIEQSYINGQKGNSVKIKGQKTASKDQLPKLVYKPNIELSHLKKFSLDDFDTSLPIVNTFSAETLLIDISNVNTLSNLIIKGNVILYSTGAINISNYNTLEDIVLFAKRVTINEAFSGVMHIVANDDVVIEKNAELKYPSSVYVEHQTDSIMVDIKENAKIAGGIVINGGGSLKASKNKLNIEQGAEVYGMVYCQGNTQLKGSVFGSLYTDRFYLKTTSASYENTILNGTIDASVLPKNFIQIPIFKSQLLTNGKYEIIKGF